MPELVVSAITRGARRVVEVVNDLDAEGTEIDCFRPDSFAVPAFPSGLQNRLADFSGFLRDGKTESFEVLLTPLRDVLPGLLDERRTRQ